MINKLHWQSNLKIIQEGDITYLLPWNHYKIWDKDHKFTIKRAASVVVLIKGIIVKNILEEAYEYST